MKLRGQDNTLAGWPRRTTLILRAIKPSTMLSTAALVSAQASMGVKGFTGLLLTMTSMKASRVRVFPVPGGPCKPCVASDTHSQGGLTSKKKDEKKKRKTSFGQPTRLIAHSRLSAQPCACQTGSCTACGRGCHKGEPHILHKAAASWSR